LLRKLAFTGRSSPASYAVDDLLPKQALRPEQQEHQRQHVGKPDLDAAADKGAEIHLGQFLAQHPEIELQVEAVPYLYRYLVPVLADTAAAAEWVASVLRAERDAIANGRIAAIGRRIVAQNQPLKNSRITPAS